jgi:hypothetical protein
VETDPRLWYIVPWTEHPTLSIFQFIVLIPFSGFEFFGLPMSGNIHNLVDVHKILKLFSCTYVKHWQTFLVYLEGILPKRNFSFLAKDREF